MKRKIVRFGLILYLSLAAAGTRPVRAEEPADGPKVIFRDDFIDRLAGTWKLTRKIRGREEVNTVEATWVLNHQFLQIHMRDAAQPPQYEALLLVGYSHADKRYVAHWTDTWGGRFSAIGSGERSGDSVEFKFQFPGGPFFNTFRWDPANRGWTFRMESVGADGKRSLFAEDTLQRP
jgi:hypothetical protein